MPDSVYKVIELVGSSTELWEKAAKAAVDRAAKSLRDLRVAEVVEQDMVLKDGKVEAYRAKVKVSFKFEGKGLTCGLAPRHLSGHAQTSSSSKASGETDVTRLFIAMLVLGLAGCTSTSSLFTSNEPPPPPPAPAESAAPPPSQGAPAAGPRGPMTPAASAAASPAALRRASCWSA